MQKEINAERVDIKARYQRAERLDQGVFTNNAAFNTTLYPHWVENTDCFWYQRDTKTGQGDDAVFGKNYRLVNAQTKDNQPAFDHQALAQALAKASGQAIDASNLQLADLVITLNPRRVTFTAFDRRWVYQEPDHSCKLIEHYSSTWKLSPDGKKAAFFRDNNIWLRDLDSQEEKALTQDGEPFFVYGGAPTVYGRAGLLSKVDVLWSSDSKRLLTQVIDTRDVELGAPLVEYVPRDGSLRPKILHPDRRVGLPGDETLECHQFLTIEVNSATVQYANYRPCPVFYPPYSSFFNGGRGWWDGDNRHAYFIDQELDGQVLKLIRFDSQTGDTEVLIKEASDFALTLIPISHINTLNIPLPDTNELIWFSERSGWAHLYLYDMASGKLKNSITQGDWLVRNVIRFDAESRELFIQTAGREKGRNPYYCDICRVNIDTGELTPLVSSDHEYIVCDQRSRITAFSAPDAVGVSPSGRYVVTTRSRVDEVPVSLLVDLEKNDTSTLETADISGLPEGWQWPEPVMLKAADKQTDIYAVVFRPSDFSADKSYPIIDLTYFYSAPAGSFSNSNVAHFYLIAASYAELGFIVVMLNGRGNEGLRHRAFNHYQEPALSTNPLRLKPNKADCVAGIQQLAARYPYIDLQRVGVVVPQSSVAAAVEAMFLYPDFYKVGVNLNPIVDGRIFPACGLDKADGQQLEALAGNLKGKLLLIHGMMDDVVPVAQTLRIVEALQKANKRFDMLLLPNLEHAASTYTVQRTWDYVVEHLLGVQPPEDFVLNSRN